jgi:mannonate dehydratase
MANQRLTQSFRWFGPDDPVSLGEIRQCGATDIVTALHHIPNGEVWSIGEIEKRQTEIEKAGLRWSVVESLPVTEEVKTRSGPFSLHLENYRQSLKNLAKAGILTIAYNFMPVLDWTRTNLNYRLPNGVTTLRYVHLEVILFDLFLLKRKGAEWEYTDWQQESALKQFEQISEAEKTRIISNILKGLPGAEEGYALEKFKAKLSAYDSIDHEQLRSNLVKFLQEVTPVAEANKMKLVIHPDDPPFDIFGLPRIMSTYDDVEKIFDAVPSPSNGLCFCTGSFGVRADNDLRRMAQAFKERVHFIHLRSTQRDQSGNFHEADHLEGDAGIPEVLKIFIEENQKREAPIPFRPDHGYQMLDDLNKQTNPGYSCIGRMKGLAEIRGLETGILAML